MRDNYRLPTAPQSIGRVLDAGTQLYKVAFSRLVGLALAAQFAIFVPPLVAALLGKSLNIDSDVALSAVLYGATAVVFIGPYLGVLVRSWRIAIGDDLPAGEAVLAGYRLSPRWLGAGILYSIAAVVGMMLLIVPGIYLAMALSLFSVVVVSENCGAVASLSRSRALVSGHWWRATTIVSVPFVLIIVVALVAQVLPLFVLGIDFSNGELKASPLVQFSTAAVSTLLNGLLTPWGSCVGFALYNDLRLRREGDDLSQRLAGLAASA